MKPYNIAMLSVPETVKEIKEVGILDLDAVSLADSFVSVDDAVFLEAYSSSRQSDVQLGAWGAGVRATGKAHHGGTTISTHLPRAAFEGKALALLPLDPGEWPQWTHTLSAGHSARGLAGSTTAKPGQHRRCELLWLGGLR